MKHVTAIAILLFIGYIIFKLETVDQPQIIREVVAETLEPETQILERATVINALRSEAQIVGLSGKVDKTVRFKDENWLGKREAVMTLKGTFKLGVNIADIRTDHIMVSESGTVVIVMPKPVLIAIDLPYDHMRIEKDSGLLRKNVGDEELQALYKKARGLVISDITADKSTQKEATILTQRAIEQLLRAVPGVKEVNFIEG